MTFGPYGARNRSAHDRRSDAIRCRDLCTFQYDPAMRTSLRRLAWVTLTIWLLLAAVWVVSLRWGVRYEHARFGAGVYDGVCGLWYIPAPDGRGEGWRASGVTRRRDFWTIRYVQIYSTPRENAVSLPLWMPLLLLGAATLWLFRSSARLRPGTCRVCGYDLTGNTSGTCPECGAAR
jgi:hypothetical protein